MDTLRRLDTMLSSLLDILKQENWDYDFNRLTIMISILDKLREIHGIQYKENDSMIARFKNLFSSGSKGKKNTWELTSKANTLTLILSTELVSSDYGESYHAVVSFIDPQNKDKPIRIVTMTDIIQSIDTKMFLVSLNLKTIKNKSEMKESIAENYLKDEITNAIHILTEKNADYERNVNDLITTGAETIFTYFGGFK